MSIEQSAFNQSNLYSIRNVPYYDFTFNGPVFDQAMSPLEAFFSPLADTARPVIRSNKRFAASVKIYHLGMALLILNHSDPFRFGRSIAKARGDGLDHYIFYMPQSRGTAFMAPNMSERLQRLDMVVANLAYPLDIVIGSGRGVGLVVPRLRLSPLLGERDGVHALLLNAGSPAGALLGRHLLTLARHASDLRVGHALRYAEATALLAGTCVAAAAPGVPSNPVSSVPRGLGRKARDYIERNLHDPRLGTGTVAPALHVSRTQLYRQFEPWGGVHRYIRGRRLHHAFQQVCGLDPEPRRISDIAYSLGFASEAHFSRLFRERFGLSPRVARAAARRDGVAWPAGTSGAERSPLEQWLRDLTVV